MYKPQLIKQDFHDYLGDMYMERQGVRQVQGKGQFLTPDSVADLMAKMTIGEDITRRINILDPCVGTGRLLISAYKQCKNSNLFGVSLENHSDNNTVTNNTVNSNDYGISIFDNSNFNNISNNKILNNNKTGIRVSNCYPWGWWCAGGNSNNTIQGNEILNNGVGIFSNQSNSTINSNIVCNTNSDFNSSGWLSSSGYNNTCNNAYSWNDDGTTGCTHVCDCYCDSCPGCEYKLNHSECTTLILSGNITDHSGTCINNPANFNNKVFDCRGYEIDGTDSWTTYGIHADNSGNLTIENCILTDWKCGIYIKHSDSNNITNNTLNSNYYGIHLYYSDSNNITNNTANSNGDTGINLQSSSNNTITGNNVNSTDFNGI